MADFFTTLAELKTYRLSAFIIPCSILDIQLVIGYW